MNNTFWEDVVDNFKLGILLLVKYSLFIIAIIYAYTFMQNTYFMAQNGQQAAIFLSELQKKGYLPKIENGVIPEKIVEKK